MVVLEWGEPSEQFVGDGEAVSGQLFDGGVDVEAVEQDYAVEGHSEGAELVLHALAVMLAQFAALPEEDLPGEAVAGLGDENCSSSGYTVPCDHTDVRCDPAWDRPCQR